MEYFCPRPHRLEDGRAGRPLLFEQAAAPPDDDRRILIYLDVRKATGVPLDSVAIDQPRTAALGAEASVEGQPGKTERVLETPKEPAHWPVHVFYLKPVVVLLNVVPMLVFLVLYASAARPRTAEKDWAWMLSLAAGASGERISCRRSSRRR